MKILGFPIFLLFFMVPLPAVIYNQITLATAFRKRSCGEIALAAGNPSLT